MSNFPNQAVVYLEGNPVEVVSLVTPTSTPDTAPKVINGSERRQIMIADPLTGVPVDLVAMINAGGGATSFATLSDRVTADIVGTNTGVAAVATSNAHRLDLPAAWDASINSPALASGTAAARNSYVVTITGTTTLDGISNWALGDVAIFGAGGVNTWTKLASGSGSGGAGVTTFAALTDRATADIVGTNAGVGAVATVASNAATSAAARISLPLGWDASGNTPTLASGTSPGGLTNSYVVTTAGATTLDGISVWALGDIAIFGVGGTSTWSKISASAVAWGGITGTLSSQTDLNTAMTSQTSNSQSGTNYVPVLGDAGKVIRMTSSSANTVTIPLNATVAYPVDTILSVSMDGTGATTIAATGGVTLVKPSARSLTISAQYETAFLQKTATDTWRVLAS